MVSEEGRARFERVVLWHRFVSKRSKDVSEPEPGMIIGWARTVRARLRAAGGDVLAQVSGTVVAVFDASDVADIIESALDLFEVAEQERVAIAIGLALGPVEDGAGRAVESAELLATRARAGELVCDPVARERLDGHFEWGRHVPTGVGGPRGTAIDRHNSRRRAQLESDTLTGHEAPVDAPNDPDETPSFVAFAENAVRSRDMIALDRLLERAIVSGSDMAAIARIRALADLLRGDIGKAKQGLAQARRYKKASAHLDPRESIAEAAVALGGGDPTTAVRLALRALAITRRSADRKGEVAALRMLAASFQALGRFEDAVSIEQAAR